MDHTTSRLRTFPLALVASAIVALSACSKNDAGVATPTAAIDTPTQVATAPAVTPLAPAPVVVAQANTNGAYEQGRRDQSRQDLRHERTERTLAPRADRDTDLAPARTGDERWRHEQQVAAAACHECGVVESVAAVKVQGVNNGAGAVAGGVGGAVVGNRIAGSHNRVLGGVLGAVGGGLIGNAIEKHERTTTAYDVNVRMSDGSLRTVRESTQPAIGEKVRVDADGLHARS
jgi:outer membrane lipoprotein SlyB